MQAVGRTVEGVAPSLGDSLVPISIARQLLGGATGKAPARATVLALAARGELEVHDIAGRFVVLRSSIDDYLARRALVGV